MANPAKLPLTEEGKPLLRGDTIGPIIIEYDNEFPSLVGATISSTHRLDSADGEIVQEFFSTPSNPPPRIIVDLMTEPNTITIKKFKPPVVGTIWFDVQIKYAIDDDGDEDVVTLFLDSYKVTQDVTYNE